MIPAYETGAGKFNNKVANMLLYTSKLDADELSDEQLKIKLEQILMEEVKDCEFLSRSKTIIEAMKAERRAK